MFSSNEQPNFLTDTVTAVRKAYETTDTIILEKSTELGRGGSTAVTAILIDGEKLVVANVGDSRAIICKNGKAQQLSVDHEPVNEKKVIESKGGFVSNFPGNHSFTHTYAFLHFNDLLTRLTVFFNCAHTSDLI